MGAQAVRLSNVDIDNALKNRDFEVLFQPIFDLGNGALARVETFVRWRHPSLGALPPGAFISFFESQGRMSELTRYILAEALDQYIEWRGASAPGFSINLALSDLNDEAFAAHFTKHLRDKNFPPDLVTLECPMPPVDMSLEAASKCFDTLAETGARIAIEVRGRANDLLRNIDPFPFHEIKTGGSAILRFARTVRGPGMSAISDLLDIAGKANAAIIAVGVEDQASLSALRGLGFTAAQGNYLGGVGEIKDFMPSRVNEVREFLGLTPLSADDLAALFRTQAPSPLAADKNIAPSVDGENDEDLTQTTNALPKKDQSAAPAAPVDADNDRAATSSGKKEDVVDRLNKRVASQNDTAPEEETSAEKELTEQAEKTDAEPKRKSKLSAAQIAKAKVKMRDKAKALALAKRAKVRVARKKAAIERAKSKAGTVTEPHAMQSRIEEEFAELTDGIGSDTANRASAEEISSEIIDVEPDAIAPDATPTVQKADDTEREIEDVALPASMKLAVGASNAFFQPGVSVRTSQEPTASLALFPSDPAPDDGGVLDEGLKSGTLFHDTPATIANDKPLAKDPIPVARKVDRAPKNITEATPEAAAPAAQTASTEAAIDNEEIVIDRPRSKKKNFLTRKYKVVPTHFWPKSWKRKYNAWKRENSDSQVENKAEGSAAD